MIKISVKGLYDELFARFGERNWWPAQTQFEVMVGAILTQNTAWSNVESAINNLKKQNKLDIESLAKMPVSKLEKAVFPTGFYKQKTKRLKNLSTYLLTKYKGDLNKLFSKPIFELRKELLNLKGIGYETADSIILYAGKKPIFVVDAYTKRLCDRLGLITTDSYDELQQFFMDSLLKNVKLFNNYHALIVEFCKSICKRKPDCVNCFLSQYCLYFHKNK